MDLSLKARKIEASVTLAITSKAKELKEQGVDVVSFGAGEPDYNTPKNIIEAAKKAMDEGNTKYTATSGVIKLREAICDKLKVDNNLQYDISQIVVSTGAKQCLANAFLAILNPGDEVIVPTPYWVSYPELISLADGIPIYCECKKENNYKYTIDSLEKVVNDKTKAIILNSPNNPTGTIYTKEELVDIAEFAKIHDLIIISDEIYEKLIYGDKKHYSIATLSEDTYNRTIVINGFSKSYAMTGWRIGYSASNKEIAKLMTNIQSHMTSNTCSITQAAAIEALNGPQTDIEVMIKEFEKRRNYMVERIESIQMLSLIYPEGAFYVMINIESLIGKFIDGKKIDSAITFAKLILDEEKVAVIPGEAFGVNNYIRLSYATSMENINKGLNRIENFIGKLI